MKLQTAQEKLQWIQWWIYSSVFSEHQIVNGIVNRYRDIIEQSNFVIAQWENEYNQWFEHAEDSFAQAISDTFDCLDFIWKYLAKK